MAALGAPAPEFSLPDLSGRLHRLMDYRGQRTLICFWSAACPWSERADREMGKWPPELASAAGLLRVAMNADESIGDIRREAAKRFEGIVLLDPDRKMTDAYGAQLTPEFFLLDGGGMLRYHGALDDATFRQPVPNRPYLEHALRALLASGNPAPAETPGYGCAIVRWKI